MRTEKTYNGELMEKGSKNEEIILKWLKSLKENKKVIDLRNDVEMMKQDIDFKVIKKNGKELMIEVKSDKHIAEDKNLLFENQRINCFVDECWNYQGWGWRSNADRFIIRNPDSQEAFIFKVLELRRFIAKYITQEGKDFIRCMSIVETDSQKTTFNYLINFKEIPKSLYKKTIIKER
jgi:hypothetical protein